MRTWFYLFAIHSLLNCHLRAAEWTEQTVVQLFLDQNPIQRETRARVAASEAETRARTLWANPAVGVIREGAGRTEFYQATQTLPWSGRNPLLRQSGQYLAATLDAEGGFSLWQARCALRAAFYRSLAVQLRQEIFRQTAAELSRFIQILKFREEAGEGSRFDRLRAERELAELELATTLHAADLALAQGEMLAYLPPQDGPVKLAGSLSPHSPQRTLPDWIQRALAQRPDILAEQRRLAQFRAEQRAAQRLRIPEPALTAGLKRADLGQPNLATGPSLGLTLSLPIFNNGSAEVSRWAAEQQRAAARLAQLSRRVEAGIHAAWQAFHVHLDAHRSYSQNEVSQELVTIATTAYEEGEITILQLLDAIRLRHEHQLRRLDLAALAKQSQIALESQIGEEFPQ